MIRKAAPRRSALSSRRAPMHKTAPAAEKAATTAHTRGTGNGDIANATVAEGTATSALAAATIARICAESRQQGREPVPGAGHAARRSMPLESAKLAEHRPVTGGQRPLGSVLVHRRSVGGGPCQFLKWSPHHSLWPSPTRGAGEPAPRPFEPRQGFWLAERKRQLLVAGPESQPAYESRPGRPSAAAPTLWRMPAPSRLPTPSRTVKGSEKARRRGRCPKWQPSPSPAGLRPARRS